MAAAVSASLGNLIATLLDGARSAVETAVVVRALVDCFLHFVRGLPLVDQAK